MVSEDCERGDGIEVGAFEGGHVFEGVFKAEAGDLVASAAVVEDWAVGEEGEDVLGLFSFLDETKERKVYEPGGRYLGVLRSQANRAPEAMEPLPALKSRSPLAWRQRISSLWALRVPMGFMVITSQTEISFSQAVRSTFLGKVSGVQKE